MSSPRAEALSWGVRARRKSIASASALALVTGLVAFPGSASAATLPARGATVGTANYAVPAGAIVVSPSGNDAAAGTLAAPLKTIAKAVTKATSGKTIVLRAGTYNETANITATNVTIQAYPKEAVWMDGSVKVSNWTQSGSVWVSTGWTARLDRSTSYTQGDTSTRLLDPAYPLASWPEQVWIDGTPLKQVSSAAAVVSGTFYVDLGAKALRIGSNPSGHEVRSSNKEQAIYSIATGTKIQGFGVRRYGTSIPDSGAVRLGNAGGTVRDMVITDNATIGLSLRNNNHVVDNVVSSNNGMLGIGANAAYNLVIKDSIVDNNNLQHFKPAPVSGGIKVTRSRGVTVTNSEVSKNLSAGIWCDESCYNVNVTNNVVNNNSTTGIQLELSELGIIAGNQTLNNNMGIQIINTGGVKIFNNEIGGSKQFGIKLSGDTRRNSNTSLTGHDPQRPNPDSTVPWIIKNIVISNNVFGSGGLYQFYSLDGKANLSTDAMKVTINGNLFNNYTAKGQAHMVGWGGGDNHTVTNYDTPAALAAAKNSTWRNAGTASMPISAMGSYEISQVGVAVGLPSDVAAATGMAAGTKKLGVF